jgi:hypothetical protein
VVVVVVARWWWWQPLISASTQHTVSLNHAVKKHGKVTTQDFQPHKNIAIPAPRNPTTILWLQVESTMCRQGHAIGYNSCRDAVCVRANNINIDMHAAQGVDIHTVPSHSKVAIMLGRARPSIATFRQQ